MRITKNTGKNLSKKRWKIVRSCYWRVHRYKQFSYQANTLKAHLRSHGYKFSRCWRWIIFRLPKVGRWSRKGGERGQVISVHTSIGEVDIPIARPELGISQHTLIHRRDRKVIESVSMISHRNQPRCPSRSNVTTGMEELQPTNVERTLKLFTSVQFLWLVYS